MFRLSEKVGNLVPYTLSFSLVADLLDKAVQSLTKCQGK